MIYSCFNQAVFFPRGPHPFYPIMYDAHINIYVDNADVPCNVHLQACESLIVVLDCEWGRHGDLQALSVYSAGRAAFIIRIREVGSRFDD